MNQTNQFDLIWIFNVIWRRKWMIVGFIILAVFVSGAVLLYLPPSYSASATLMIEPSDKLNASEYTAIMTSERLALTYRQILTSRPVLEQVIEELGLQISVEELTKKVTVQNISNTRLIRVTVTNASPIWVVLVANAITENFITYIDTLSVENYHQSLNYMQTSINQKQVEIDSIISSIDAQKNQNVEFESELASLELQLNNNRDNYLILQQNSQTLETSITQFTNKIHVVQAAQLDGSATNPPYTAILLMYFDQDILTGNVESTAQLSDLIDQVYAPMLVQKEIIGIVIDQLDIAGTPEELQGQIAVATLPGTQFLELRVSAEDGASAIQIANTIASIFIEQNQSTLAEPYLNQLEEIEAEMNDLTIQMADIQNNIKTISTNQTAVELELERLNTELSTKYSDKRDLQNNYDLLLIDMERSSNTIVVSEPAEEPIKRSQNRILYMGISVLMAGGLGIGLAYLLEQVEDKVRTQEDIIKLLDQKPIGVIGHIDKGKPKLILGENSSLFVNEDFRKLSAFIRPVIEDVPIQKLLITSPGPGEGKSTVASNLAIALANTGSKVILVDADMHRPQLELLFGLNPERGLSEHLTSGRKIAHLRITSYQNLQVLSSGELPDDATQLLSSSRLGNVLDTLASKGDLLIIDSPPLLSLADASFLAPLVDGALLVINAGNTERKATVEAMAMLKMTKIQFIGVVLNDLATRSHLYYKYYDKEHQKSTEVTN